MPKETQEQKKEKIVKVLYKNFVSTSTEKDMYDVADEILESIIL